MRLSFLLISCFLISFNSSGQETVYASTDVKDLPSSFSSVPKAINHNYEQVVASLDLSKQITGFRSYVANHGQMTTSDRADATREFEFKNQDDFITVQYGADGSIIRSQETYRSTKLPNEVRSQIIKEHPGWHITASQCTIIYEAEKMTKVKFKVVVEKDSMNKTIQIEKKVPAIH